MRQESTLLVQFCISVGLNIVIFAFLIFDKRTNDALASKREETIFPEPKTAHPVWARTATGKKATESLNESLVTIPDELVYIYKWGEIEIKASVWPFSALADRIQHLKGDKVISDKIAINMLNDVETSANKAIGNIRTKSTPGTTNLDLKPALAELKNLRNQMILKYHDEKESLWIERMFGGLGHYDAMITVIETTENGKTIYFHETKSGRQLGQMSIGAGNPSVNSTSPQELLEVITMQQ